MSSSENEEDSEDDEQDVGRRRHESESTRSSPYLVHEKEQEEAESPIFLAESPKQENSEAVDSDTFFSTSKYLATINIKDLYRFYQYIFANFHFRISNKST